MSRELGPCPACTGDGVAVVRTAPWPGVDLVRCAGCGTEFLDPQPTDARLAEIYGASYYEPWFEESEAVVRRTKEMTFAPILDRAGLCPGQRVLDVGCATGQLAALAARRGLDVYGVDLNPAAIAAAREAVPTGHFHAGVLAEGPFPAASFDAVVMIDFIEHVRDPYTELCAVRERLAEGGRVVISTPRVDSVTRRVTGRHWPQYREEHLTYFTLVGMYSLLQRAGFTVVSASTTTKYVTPAYLYGQARAYPVPVVSPLAERLWPVAPIPKHRPIPLRFGEMTVVASRRSC